MSDDGGGQQPAATREEERRVVRGGLGVHANAGRRSLWRVCLQIVLLSF